MTKSKSRSTKSCGPQPLLEEMPSSSWSTEQLKNYAQSEHATIVDGEKLLAPNYWKLGMALSLARKQLKRGEFSTFLADLGIEKTRASKARAIFRTFGTVNEVAGKSVEEAYAERRQMPTTSRKRSNTIYPDIKVLPLEAFLSQLQEHAGRLQDEVAFATGQQAQSLLANVEELLHRLKELEQQLRERVSMNA